MLSATKHLVLVRPFHAKTQGEILRGVYPESNEKDPSLQFILSQMKRILRYAQNDNEGLRMTAKGYEES